MLPTPQETVDNLIDEALEGIVTVTPNKSKIEEEQALIIRSDDPLKVIEEMAQITSIGTYKVGPAEEHFIVDRFYDSDDGAIRAAKSSFRIRELDGVPFVTVKGKNKSLDGASKRSELEFKWPYENPSPYDFVTLFGLTELQKRETKRLQKDITSTSYVSGIKHKQLVAELALDEVLFTFADGQARFYEVEIELKSEKVDLKAFITPLLNKYECLEPWKHSKFSTGKAIEYALRVQLDEQGTLKASSFDIISYMLKV